MELNAIISSLNDAQREAVSASNNSMLVLAGAGSGKTRVLVHRIAWLIKVDGAYPSNILSVTFTNKAAAEMRGRVESLLKMPAGGMWIGTFHGLTHRFLRRHAAEAKLPDTFQILDSDDQYRLIKRLMKNLGIDESRCPPRQVQWFINEQKDEGLRAAHVDAGMDPFRRQLLKIYAEYEANCQRSGLVDFAELLLRSFELLRDTPALLEEYQSRFRYILVDEFQDTNAIQYAWLRLLSQGRENMFVVGDDDQSIYGWRGARVENIHTFQKDNPAHKVVRLEQNYRSTGNILGAANSVIANNAGRMGKELWTEDSEGEKISLYNAFNEQDEAHFVVERIRKWSADGNARGDAAILYRSNAQSRLFEEKLMASAIPYRVYGGQRFFDRAEIKNGLAYLRLIANKNDDPSFERIVNTPTRGIGSRTVDLIRAEAQSESSSLWEAAISIINRKQLPARASNALNAFLALINGLTSEAKDKVLFEKVRIVVEKSGLIEHYKKEKGEKGEARIENLEELANAAKQFVWTEDEGELDELSSFLAHAALEAGEGQAEEYDDCVQLMTLHSAKGLEFKLVFVVGLEEGLFPGERSITEPGRLEEERRLCYVGMTRAMEKLYLTYAESRRLYGRETYPKASRFLREIPEEHIEEVRMRATISRPVSVSPSMSQKEAEYRLGQRVYHAKFGEGVVLQQEGEGDSAQIQINFNSVGIKTLVAGYAKLEKL